MKFKIIIICAILMCVVSVCTAGEKKMYKRTFRQGETHVDYIGYDNGCYTAINVGYGNRLSTYPLPTGRKVRTTVYHNASKKPSYSYQYVCYSLTPGGECVSMEGWCNIHVKSKDIVRDFNGK